jgi:hypothetical protein
VDALRWLDAGDYGVWQSVLMALRAAVEVGDMADHEARELWVTWSATAPADRQARNERSQYAPAAMWDRRSKLTTSARILAASLFAKARDNADKYVRAELSGPLSERGRDGAVYLRRHHKATFKQIIQVTTR